MNYVLALVKKTHC